MLLCVQMESCIPPPGNGKASVSSPFVRGNNLLLSLNSVAADCFPPTSSCSVCSPTDAAPPSGVPALVARWPVYLAPLDFRPSVSDLENTSGHLV